MNSLREGPYKRRQAPGAPDAQPLTPDERSAKARGLRRLALAERDRDIAWSSMRVSKTETQHNERTRQYKKLQAKVDRMTFTLRGHR